MNNNFEIKSFTVYKLFGLKNHTINFCENRSIIFGINGSYKTTMLTIFYLCISQKYEELITYEFDKLEIILTDETIFSISLEGIKYMDHYNILDEVFNIEEINSETLRDQIETISTKYNRNKLEEKELDIICEIWQELWNLRLFVADIGIVFLPSYRHIESKLLETFGNRNRNRNRYTSNRYLNRNQFIDELDIGDDQDIVTKGMDSISVRIKNEILKSESESLNITTKYAMSLYKACFLGKITEITDAEINILARLSEDDLRKHIEIVKEYLGDNLDVQSIIKKFKDARKKALNAYANKNYSRNPFRNIQPIIKAINSFIPMRKEIEDCQLKISNFFEICNIYLENSNKSIVKEQFKKNEDNVILLENGKMITMNGLSSGEQQLLSIFTRIYLFPTKKDLFIIIDEPEMSLSMPWQNNFLVDIMNGTSTKGLLVATHSPDIIENIDKKYISTIQTDFPLEENDTTDEEQDND